MRILFLTSGRYVPTSRFRVNQFLPKLKEAGHEFVVSRSIPEKYQGFPLIGTRLSEFPRRLFRLRDVFRAGAFDVVFLERELFSTPFDKMEEWIRKRARSLVWDVDDALFLIHPDKFQKLARICDWAIAGNRFLADKIRPSQPKTVVVPTVVDVNRYPVHQWDSQPADKVPLIGWTGLSSNIHYLEPILPELKALRKEYRFELRIIAESDKPLRKLDLTGLDLSFQNWSESHEIEDLASFDIGLMPLPDETWAHYKCGLKLIQYMALGIPSVASSIGVNPEITREGREALLVQSPSDWKDALGKLLADRELCQRIGSQARLRIEESYSIDALFPRWLATLETAAASH